MKSTELQAVLNLIKQERLRRSTSRGELIESESDKGRVINSASFRRLQQKAQVFPLDPNAAVRTRLTHSIEVSQVGRHIAQKIIGNENADYQKLAAFVNTIETACLLHDLGNPPFGHFGEHAIQEWFKEKRPKIGDLLNFDGNPQAFRMMSFLEGDDDFGYNLTATLLLSTVKYPWSASKKPADKKKIGLFDSDLRVYEEACGLVGWKEGCPFPLMLLMDVADDIAYSMSDLEDGLEKKILSEKYLQSVFNKDRVKKDRPWSFLSFKIEVINRAVESAANKFSSDLESILAGKGKKLIDESSDIGRLLVKVKKFATKHVYADESAEHVELAGRSVLKGLLNHFEPLLDLSENDFKVLLKDDPDAIRKAGLGENARLFRRLPIRYSRKLQSSRRGDVAYRAAHLIVDSVSGMTDDSALELYQILEGIRVK